tara:strand:+ start:4843 stop:6342 length:1500 start_codon:yes stop_codon:yes gene_type:complete
MKNEVKKILTFGLALFTIGFFLTRCEKNPAEEEPTLSKDQEPKFTLKHYSSKDIEKNDKLASRLKGLKDRLIEHSSAKYTGKGVYKKEYDFTIYTDSATYIENGDYHSYTFPLVQDEKEKMVNVLFETNDRDGYDAYLVRYDYTAKEFRSLDLESLSLVTSMEPLDLDLGSLSSKTYSAYVCIYSYERHCSEGWVNGSGGNLGGTAERCYWSLTASQCETVLYADEDYTAYHNNTATVTVSGTTYSSTSGTTTSPTPSPFDAEELMKISVVKSELDLNRHERIWIDKWENGQYAFRLYDFGTANMWSEKARVLGKNAVASGTNASLVTLFPFVKYPDDKAAQYKSDYPKLTEYLKRQLPKVANIPKIMDAIHGFTKLPKDQIKNDLQWGEGPELHIVQLDNYNSDTDSDTMGYFDKEKPNQFFLDIDYVRQMENGTLIQNDNDAAIFFIGTTVLHEYVHYGDYNSGFDYPGEEGRMFEISVYGENVQPDRARIVLNRIN